MYGVVVAKIHFNLSFWTENVVYYLLFDPSTLIVQWTAIFFLSEGAVWECDVICRGLCYYCFLFRQASCFTSPTACTTVKKGKNARKQLTPSPRAHSFWRRHHALRPNRGQTEEGQGRVHGRSRHSWRGVRIPPRQPMEAPTQPSETPWHCDFGSCRWIYS